MDAGYGLTPEELETLKKRIGYQGGNPTSAAAAAAAGFGGAKVDPFRLATGAAGSEASNLISKNPVALAAGGIPAAIGTDNMISAAKSPLGMAAIGGAAAPLIAANPLLAGGIGAAVLGGHKSTHDIQNDRWKDSGHEDPNKGAGYDYFQGTEGEGSRDEKYLSVENILKGGSPDIYNNVPDWDQWHDEAKRTYLQHLIDTGKINEKKGGLYFEADASQSLADQMRKSGAAIDMGKQIAQEMNGQQGRGSALPSGTYTPDAGTAKRWREAKEKKDTLKPNGLKKQKAGK